MELLDSDLVGLSVTARGERLGRVELVWGDTSPRLASLGAGVMVPLTRTRVLPSAHMAEVIDLDLDPALLESAPRTRLRPDEAHLALLELHFGIRPAPALDLSGPGEPDGPLVSTPPRISPGVAAAALDPDAIGAQRFSDHAFDHAAGLATGPAPGRDLPLGVAGADVVNAHASARAERLARDTTDPWQALDLSTPTDPGVTEVGVAGSGAMERAASASEEFGQGSGNATPASTGADPVRVSPVRRDDPDR